MEKLTAYKMTVGEAEEKIQEHLDNSGLHLTIRRTGYTTYYIAQSDIQQLDGAELDERFAEILGVKRGRLDMKQFDVEITEMSAKTVTVEAGSRAEACEKVEAMWNRGDVVLGAEDFLHADFDVVEERKI